MNQGKFKFSLLIILLIALSLGWVNLNMKRWATPQGVIDSDVVSYYEYLPAFFIYHDLSLQFKNNPDFKTHSKFWTHELPGKRYVIKMSMGLSMLYLPFFTGAHVYCKVTGTIADGFSVPYQIALILSSIFYSVIGFMFLRKLLLLYFSEIVTSLCLLVIGWGTNYFNYATLESCMSHIYLFCLINVFIWYVIKWHQTYSVPYTLAVGITGGLIALVRPTNILIYLVFLLFNVKNKKDFVNRIKLLWKEKLKIIILAILFLVIWSPQLAYWKYNSGNWLFFSYVGERFFFNHPHIADGLFSYRKGWLLYTPLMVISLTGFIPMRKQIPEFFSGVLVFFILSTYIILSWWCWWYGGSFGQRPFIDMYGLLCLPMGCIFSFIFKKVLWKKMAFTCLILFLIGVQLFQSYQYYTGSIHWDSMTKEAYWASFLKKNTPQGWHYLLKEPDYNSARNTGIEKQEH